MKTEQKIYVAIGLLVALGGGYYVTRQNKQKEISAHSATAATADLPAIGVSKDDVEALTKIEIKNADKGNVTLEKKGDAWELTAPLSAKANTSNVRSVLDNLKDIKVKESIDRGTATYGQYELNDEKGVHVVAYKGDAKVFDAYFGKSGSRGQLARINGKDGVWVVGGYSGFLYTREVKNWRETSILKFEDANVIQVSVTNPNGQFSFSKNDDKWSGSYAKRDKDKKLEKPEKKWEKFDEAKVKDMLRAYKSLTAEDFGDEKSDTGLAEAEANGGVVQIKLKDNAGDLTVKVGKVSKGTSRYAIKDGGDGVIYVLSSYSADWATADKAKFEKSDDKKKGDKVEYPWDNVHFVEVPADGKISRAMAVPGGDYEVFIAVKEKNTGDKKQTAKTGVLRQDLTVPDFNKAELATSSVIVADTVEPVQTAMSNEQQQENPYTFGTMKIVPATMAMVMTWNDSTSGNHVSVIAMARRVPCSHSRNSIIGLQ